jgi:chromosome segregation ATPase
MARQKLPPEDSGSASAEEAEMAKLRKESNAAISLFPFLSILACTIGTLILILAGMVLGQIGKGSAYKKIKEIEKQKEEILRESRELQPKLIRAKNLENSLKERQKQAQEKGLPTSPDEIERILALLQAKMALDPQVQDLEIELKRAEKEHEQIEDQLQKAEGGIIRLQQEHEGLGKGLTPSYIECRADELFIPSRETSIPRRDIAGSDIFRSHIRYVNRQKGYSILFLIRPSGVETFEAAEKVINNLNARYGYWPIPENGEIDYVRQNANEN